MEQAGDAVRWYQFDTADDAALPALATRLHLHPLHVEDLHSEDERVKVEDAPHYVFALLRTITLDPAQPEPVLDRVCLFAGAEAGTAEGTGAQTGFFLVVADTRRPAVAAALRRAQEQRSGAPMHLLYLVFDAIVDSYFPVLDALDDAIDSLEDRVVSAKKHLLNEIFAVKRQLVDVRRLLVNTRDAAMHLQRTAAQPQDAEHLLYLRDLYDHVTRLLDMVETQRDLLNNALDIYLSSIANRTNEVMKLLTVLSTIALPALVVTSFYGMNIKGLPLVDSRYALLFVLGVTFVLTVALLWLLRRMRSL